MNSDRGGDELVLQGVALGVRGRRDRDRDRDRGVGGGVWLRPVGAGARVLLRPGMVGSSGYVGRVGALAVALGIGAAVAGVPAVAFADTSGSSGSAGSSPDFSWNVVIDGV